MQTAAREYILPTRTLSGTKAEILVQIDELIQGLVGLRQLVSLHCPDDSQGEKPPTSGSKGF